MKNKICFLGKFRLNKKIKQLGDRKSKVQPGWVTWHSAKSTTCYLRDFFKYFFYCISLVVIGSNFSTNLFLYFRNCLAQSLFGSTFLEHAYFLVVYFLLLLDLALVPTLYTRSVLIIGMSALGSL